MKTINLPQNARFSCQSCGQCCQGWAVPVDEATVQRLRKHDWGGEPFQRVSTGYHIKLVSGRCFFLDPSNRCRIHTTLSYEEKPDACRAFPLAVLEVGDKHYGRLSYWCPTVVGNTGKPLEHQARWLQDTAKHGDHRAAPVMLNDSVEIGGREFERIHRALVRILLDATLMSVGDRLAACAALIRRLEMTDASTEAVDHAIREAESAGAVKLRDEMRGAGDRSGGRRLLSLYFLQDRAPGHLSLIVRLGAILLFNLGLTPLSSRAVAARASWRAIRRVRFEPNAAGDELLTRYMRSKIESRRYIAGDASLVTGFNLLVAAYGVIEVLARLRAAAHGRLACNEEDLRLAVRSADLLVVEHAAIYQSPSHRRILKAALGVSSLAGDMLQFLGGA